jgi:hypothetical protein
MKRARKAVGLIKQDRGRGQVHDGHLQQRVWGVVHPALPVKSESVGEPQVAGEVLIQVGVLAIESFAIHIDAEISGNKWIESCVVHSGGMAWLDSPSWNLAAGERGVTAVAAYAISEVRLAFESAVHKNFVRPALSRSDNQQSADSSGECAKFGLDLHIGVSLIPPRFWVSASRDVNYKIHGTSKETGGRNSGFRKDSRAGNSNAEDNSGKRSTSNVKEDLHNFLTRRSFPWMPVVAGENKACDIDGCPVIAMTVASLEVFWGSIGERSW